MKFKPRTNGLVNMAVELYLTTEPLPKQAFHRISLMASITYLLLLHRLTVTFISPCICTSVMCFGIQSSVSCISFILRCWHFSSSFVHSFYQSGSIQRDICEERLLASSCPSVCMEQLDPHWTDFDKIWNIGFLFENLSRKFKFYQNPTRITGTLHEDVFTCLTIYR